MSKLSGILEKTRWYLAAGACLVLLSACAFDLETLQELLPDHSSTPQLEINSSAPPTRAYETLDALQQADTPQRDLRALAQRLRKVTDIPHIVRDTPYDHQVGDELPFWVSNSDTNTHFQVTASLVYITPHLYVWVENGATVDLDALRTSAELFESQTYPTNRRFFGSEWNPGVDQDPHLNILHVRGLGNTVGGYYSSSDEFSQLAHSYSNEREMFYVNLDTVVVGNTFYDGLLAHEFQHMIHWWADSNEDLWINEGLSELAAYLNGFDPGSSETSFLAQPDLQLNDFAYDGPGDDAHYGAAYLFALYFMERFGTESVQQLVAQPANGIAGVNAVLDMMGSDATFETLFADWAAALYLDAPELDAGRYGLQALDPGRPALAADLAGATPGFIETSVNQFASDYIRLSGNSPVTVTFTGTRQVNLLGSDPHEGDAFWWSNRGDDIDTSLTKALDLSALITVTLDYWLWYDIEENWDYAYLEVSSDGGQSWDTIQTPHTTEENPSGNNYGHGYTGISGGGVDPIWIHEQLDLSAYAGQQIQLRFEYITDGAIHQAGLALDALAIPQLDYATGFESEDPTWQAAGFVRSNNVLPQDFVVQLIELGEKPLVRPLPLNSQGCARWQIPLGAGLEQAILVVSATTPATLQPAVYAYQVTTGQ